ncbi:MAG TPA: bifunctional nuclease family protein [Thermomicrobiales bacterium]|jgi:bifunctional DNase/RNase|nr:bifunctional nuclease family protein [Thermomicrobiales bacterium]
MIETVVESIRVNLVTQNRVVMLKEVQGERHLPIWIGDFEAQAIAMELQGLASPRPLPYDLMKAMIVDMGGTVDRIMVTDLAQDVFYARIVIAINGRSVEIDSRPSDAIALAVRTHSPILVEEMVMERAGVSLEGEGNESEEDAETPGEATTESTSAGVDEERLGVFRDFINTLDLDDFDRKRGS